MLRRAAAVCIVLLTLLAPAPSGNAQNAPLANDLAELDRRSAHHEILAEYVDGLPPDRQLALAPTIAKHQNADIWYIAASIYIRHKMVEEAVDTVVDFAVSSDLAERYLTGLGWSMIHGADEDGTIKAVIEGLMARISGDLGELTPEQRAKLNKLLGRRE